MDDNVQEGSVSEGTESQELKQGEVSQEATSKEGIIPQSLTPDQIKEIIKESLSVEREKIRQSVADKSRYEVEQALKRATTAEQTLLHMKGSLKDVDPDTLKDLELAELRARVGISQGMEQEASIRQQQTDFDQKFHTGVKTHIAELGIDPNDKRLDWADDAKDYLEKRQRIDGSIRKVIKENTEKEKEGLSRQMKEMEAKLRQELGLDSVDTSNPVAPRKDIGKMTPSELIKEGLNEGQKKK